MVFRIIKDAPMKGEDPITNKRKPIKKGAKRKGIPKGTKRKKRRLTQWQKDLRTPADANRDAYGRYIKGTTPGPGRPISTTTTLYTKFVAAIEEVWDKRGLEAINGAIDKNPVDFLRVVASIMPRDLHIRVSKYENLSIEQLQAQWRDNIREARALGIDVSIGVASGTDSKDETGPIIDLQAVSETEAVS